MRNGFKLTLMVAIALMGMRVSAMVPVINPIPDPIIGDSDGVSGTNEFVYPDALNLSQYGSDPDNGPSPLVWSYEGVDGKYTFNGVAGLSGAESPITPPGAKSLLDNDDDPGEEDSNPATVTIRNVDLSPIGGPNVDPGAPGIVESETRTITFWASDGATAGMREITVYTDNEGEDRLSSSEEEVFTNTFADGPQGWLFSSNVGGGGVVSSSSNTGALCMTVSAQGVNDVFWYNPYGSIPLTNGSVYIGRVNLTTNQTTLSQAPLTVMIIENSSFTAFEAGDLYFSENYFLDNFGGANAPGGSHPAGSDLHTMLFTPMAVSTAKWQSEAFSAANEDFIHARMRFRILDADGVGYNAEIDSGTVCMEDVAVTKVDIGAFSRVATPFQVTNMTAAQFNTRAALNNTTFAYSGGNLTLTPTSGNWTAELADVLPGDGNFDVLAGTGMADDYPLPWTADGQIFEVVMELSAPNATAQSNPPDVVRFGIDAPTQEYIGLSWMTAARVNHTESLAMPVTGTPQEYRGFFAPNYVTLSPTAAHASLRPRFDVLVADNLGYGVGQTVNAGGITINSWTVHEVILP